MSIDEVEEITDLANFTNHEILRSVKFKCIEDRVRNNYLSYKISIGKLIFTIDILPSDKGSIIDTDTKKKLAKRAAEFVIQWIRKKIKSNANNFSLQEIQAPNIH